MDGEKRKIQKRLVLATGLLVFALLATFIIGAWRYQVGLLQDHERRMDVLAKNYVRDITEAARNMPLGKITGEINSSEPDAKKLTANYLKRELARSPDQSWLDAGRAFTARHPRIAEAPPHSGAIRREKGRRT